MIERVELVFEDENSTPDADEWHELPTRRDQSAEEALSLEVRGLRARAHADFEFNNLTQVEVSGEVLATFGLPIPDRLAVQLSVVDEAGHLLNSGQYDLSMGPTSSRSMNNTVKIYRHEDADSVKVEFFLM